MPLQKIRPRRSGEACAGAPAAPPTGKKEALFLLVLCLWLIAATFFLVGAKENLFIDEALSYRRANGFIDNEPSFFSGTKEDPADFFTNFFAATEPFQYREVFRNESQNVHPPLYYYLLHTICSLFPGQFSLLFAGAINAGFAVGTLLVYHGILRLLIDDGKTRAALCLLYALSSAVWSNLSFLRMYVMLSFWISALTYLYLANRKTVVRCYGIKLFLTVYGGIMTHHHLLLHLFAASLTYLLVLILRRDRRTILYHVGIVLAGTLSALASFPPMIMQILTSDRGTEAQQNLRNAADYLFRIRWFCGNTGAALFGTFFKAALFLSLVCIAVILLAHIRGETTGLADIPSLCMLLLPLAFYIATVSITASFLTGRYLFAALPLLLLVFGLLIHNAAFSLSMTRKYVFPLLLSLALLFSAAGLHQAQFPFLYRGDAQKREALLPYENTDCLYLVQNENMYVDMITDYMELSMYGTLTVLNASDPGTPASAFSDRDQLIVVTDEGYFYESDDLLAEVRAFCVRNGLPSQITDLGKFTTDTHTYLCSREEE